MVGQRNAQVGRYPQQLALALGERLAVQGQHVFCCDGYRIPEDRPAPPPPPIAPAAPHALPHAIARPRRAWLTRSYLENAILFVLFVIALAWYWWHLPPPRW